MIRLPDGLRLRAVVPPERRWLAMLHSGMLKVGLPVRDCVLEGGRLTISLGSGAAGDTMHLALEPGAPERSCFRRVGGERWGLSYSGRREVDEEAARWLDRFGALVDRMAERIPLRLDGFASIVVDAGKPQETLARMFPFLTIERSAGPLGENVEVLVRTTSRCDQACPFCSAPRMAEPDPAMVRACIQETGELLPGSTLSLTGGEPSLKASFLEEVRAALDNEDIGHLQVQTNAASFADRVDPTAIPISSRISFFISLHAVDPEVHDECTGARGRLTKVLEGIEAILNAGHSVTLNTVVCSANLEHLETLASGLPGGTSRSRPAWHLSALICPESNRRAASFLVPYSRLVPVVERASEIASRRGLEVSSLLSSTHAAVPPCVVSSVTGDDRRWLLHETRGQDAGVEKETHERGGPVLGGEPTRGEGPSSDRVKAEMCSSCAESARCPGVPKAYALRFGLAELRPISPEARSGKEGDQDR